MESLNDLMYPFAKVASGAVKKYSELEPSIHPLVRQELQRALRWIIRHSGALIPPDASQAALDCVNGRFDLFALKWHDQLRAENIIQTDKVIRYRKDSKLLHEHKITVNDTYNKVLQTKGDEKKILQHLSMQQVVWILRAENKGLPNSTRLDSDAAYHANGIKVIANSYGMEWLHKNAFG
jgi:hypothetical protein